MQRKKAIFCQKRLIYMFQKQTKTFLLYIRTQYAQKRNKIQFIYKDMLHQVAKIQELEYLSLWQKFNSFDDLFVTFYVSGGKYVCLRENPLNSGFFRIIFEQRVLHILVLRNASIERKKRQQPKYVNSPLIHLFIWFHVQSTISKLKYVNG